jgi:hypothetical protein
VLVLVLVLVLDFTYSSSWSSSSSFCPARKAIEHDDEDDWAQGARTRWKRV